MLASKHIRRILVAVLLLLPLSAAMAAPARNGRSLAGQVLRTAGYGSDAGLSKEERRHPEHAILSGAGHLSSAAHLQSGHSGGGSPWPVRYFDLPTAEALQARGGSTELRRWQLLSGGVRYAQLQARYPAHGFW